MNEVNPYAPPQADLTPDYVPNAQILASPWIRLAGQMIDGLIAMVIIMPIMFLTGYFSRAAQGQVTFEAFLWAPVSLAVMLGINWVFLLNGQTIGKKILNIKIVRKDGTPIDRMRIVTHRILPVWLVSNIPVINLAMIADALCIFRAGRNTLHDDIADTKVIKV